MKKLFSLTLLFVFALTTSYAQDITKAAKTAKKAVNAYKLSGDDAKLEKAKEAVMSLFKNDAANSNFDALVAKGDLHAALAGKDTEARLTAQTLGNTHEDQYTGEANMALQAYAKALPLAEKSSQTKAVLDGIDEVDNAMANDLSVYFDKQNYKEAYNTGKGVLHSYQLLSDNKRKSFIPDAAGLRDWKFYTGQAAQLAGMASESKNIMLELSEEGYEKAEVYQALFEGYIADGDEEKAFAALAKGREIDPANSGLLFSEINYLIQQKEYTKLESLLKQAIEAEPDNPSVYSTLGTVYNQLYKSSLETGDTKAEQYFNDSKEYYLKASEIDPDYFSAQYSLGELYYNKAANVITELQALESDFSKAALKKYDEKKAEMVELFSQALPYFKKAEQLDPNDLNTMIAMKEIYARKDDLATSNKLKDRYDAAVAGTKYDKPFHD